MTSEEQIAQLEKIFKPIMDWYESQLTDNPSDTESYLYDSTIEFMIDNLSRSDAVNIIETLRGVKL